MEDICQTDLQELPCGHHFHTACILSWARSDIEGHGQCPVCRSTDGAGAAPQVEISAFSYRTYRSDAQSHNLMDALAHAACDFGPNETALYKLLLRQAVKCESAEKNHRQRLREFTNNNKQLVKKYKYLNRGTWRYKYQVAEARRDLFSMFNVVTVVRRGRGGGQRTASVVQRRSARLAQQDAD